MSTTTTRPIAEGLFTWPSDDPQLIGATCAACPVTVFPSTAQTCPRCGSADMQEDLLPRQGTLWTFTTQHYRPKEPYAGPDTDETFQPFGLCYVELGDRVRVEARLTEADPAHLQIGMTMELVILPFRTDPDGTEVMSFAFRPVSR
jgi:uncharacterized protein